MQQGMEAGLYHRQSPRIRTVLAGDLEALQREIRLAKSRFGLVETVQVLSCYEAGRDGFWIYRYLVKQGIRNLIVESSSIEVNRKKRPANNLFFLQTFFKLELLCWQYHAQHQPSWKLPV